MKQIFTFLIFSLFVGIPLVSGQIFYENNFEDQDWKGITIIETPDKTPAQAVAGIGLGWSIQDAGDRFAASSTSWFAPIGQADAWMILPKLEIPIEGIELGWDALTIDPSFPDGYQVWVSTTGKEKEDFDEMIFEIDAESSSWQQRGVSLDDFVGDSIYIAFRNNSFDKYVLFIDNIAVGTRLENDIRFVSGSDGTRVPGINFGIALRGERNADLVIQNRGVTTINEFEVQFDLNGEVWVERFEDLNIEPDQSGQFLSQELLNLQVGDGNSLKIDLVSMNGIEPDNDEFRSYSETFDVWPAVQDFAATDSKGEFHSVYQDLEDGKIVVFDFLASWCPPCEFSVPALDAFYREFNDAEDHPLKVYGITIEANDNTDEIMNGLADQWGGTYPKFKWTSFVNALHYIHYDRNHELGTGGIPLFIMVCPNNSDNVAESEIIASTIGFNPSQNPDVFQASFKPAYLDCVESIMMSNVDDMRSVADFSVYPNPATDLVNISLELEQTSVMSVEVFNALGQKIETLHGANTMGAGAHNLQWQPQSSGTYFIVISDGKSKTTEKVIVLE